MAVVGEALLSAAFGSLFDKLRCSDLIKLARQEDVHTDLKKWEKQLQSIRQEINDAEKKQITQEAVKSWLFDMTVLGYDMEDILDEFAYELTRRKLMGAEAEEASTTKVRKFIPSCCTSFNPTHVVRNVETGSKIRDITSTLQDISARKAGLGLEKVTAAAATSAWQRSPPTRPIAYEPGVYGTEEDKKVILDLLGKVEPYENDVGFISIIGMGGVGKNARAVCFGEICFCLEDNLESNRQSTISKETRHSSFILGKFDVFKKFEAFQEFEHLRTFVALPIHGTFTESFVTSLVCDHLVPKSRQLRVLSLSECMIFELPDSIGGLKHLRYLNLSFTQIKLLPDSVTNLYNLQTLILSNCKHLTRLPSNIGNLISLRHLNVVGCSLQDMPQQIGKLKKLQTLSDFIVSKRGFLGIKELKDLSHLRGEICISKLENVVDVQDARDANLKAKLNVERLSMIWSKELDGSHDEDAEMEVLLSLQPHTSLKKLNIEGYGGRQFPNWICDPSYIKLVELSLIGCIRCISVPSVGQLPFLKKLVIKRMDGVKSVGLEFEGQVSLHAKPFQCLESLWFEDMKEWEEWCWSTKSFSRLRQLEIKNCPRLIKKLPTHPTSLVKLSIENCPEMMVPLPTYLPSLEELNIYYCPEMTPQFTTMNFSLCY